MKQKKVVRLSLSEQAESLIKERILALDFGPGERIVVDKLAEELGVSRTPIREGLRILVQQGLVNYNGISYSIFNPTKEDIEEIFIIHKALEPVAAELATNKISAERIADLRMLFSHNPPRDDEQSLVEIDVHFHNAIVAGAGYWRLEQILSNMQSQFRLIRGWVAK
ncbi:GntR family transcriptional regulator [Marispirochaeta sp.]|uniref:GntR family transcriptional regulator n=1 Tax=Marispirochaeta sp. TaxID=2038653 RepID=UPI0029C7DCA4|nr:GntR family transcriptional regulator [Marispirochaeta sp.]